MSDEGKTQTQGLITSKQFVKIFNTLKLLPFFRVEAVCPVCNEA